MCHAVAGFRLVKCTRVGGKWVEYMRNVCRLYLWGIPSNSPSFFFVTPHNGVNEHAARIVYIFIFYIYCGSVSGVRYENQKLKIGGVVLFTRRLCIGLQLFYFYYFVVALVLAYVKAS